MKFGKVIGNVVCTQKTESFDGVKLLLIQPLDENLAEAGQALIACDVVQAGYEDFVLYEGGREAALALENWYNPSDATVMAIVDSVDLDDRYITEAKT
jgi:microcompartment protein CcmK/EutM